MFLLIIGLYESIVHYLGIFKVINMFEKIVRHELEERNVFH